MEPTPIGIENDGCGQVRAGSAGRALLDGECGVVLSREGADLLGSDTGEEREGEQSS